MFKSSSFQDSILFCMHVKLYFKIRWNRNRFLFSFFLVRGKCFHLQESLLWFPSPFICKIRCCAFACDQPISCDGKRFLKQTRNRPCELAASISSHFHIFPLSHLEMKVIKKQINNTQKDWHITSSRSLSASGKHYSPAMQRWKISILRDQQVGWANNNFLFDIVLGSSTLW